MNEGRAEGRVQGGENGFPCRVSEAGNGVRIIAEMPGITEEKIRIDLDGKTLVISVAGSRKHRMSIALPWKARLGKKQFRNGVLELMLEKPA
jgi:HSP20 family molecular chaperone IbpA